MRKSVICIAGALVLTACMNWESVEHPEAHEVVATFMDEEATRSRFSHGTDQTNVVWTKNDAFTMVGYDNGVNVAYFSTTNDGTTSATFTTTNSLEGCSPTYSLYPRSTVRYYYNGEMLLSGSVYPEQKAVAGGVQEGVNIAAAYSNYWLDNIYFMNVLTYVRFRVTGKAVSNLASVSFDAGKTIAGDMTIRWVDGEPVASFDRNWNPVHAERSTSVTLKGTFKPDTDYFIALAPVSVDGFYMTFKDKDGLTLVKHSDLQLDMQRSRIYNFGTINIGDKFEEPTDREVIQYMKQTKGSKPNVLAVIPEGFTAEEMDQFKAVAANGIDFMFNTEPFKTYKDYFTVYFLTVPSEESGASVTNGNGTVTTGKKTFFNARWGEVNFGDMKADDDIVNEFVAAQCPEIANGTLTLDDVPILMIINDPRYAGITRFATNDGRAYSMVPVSRDDEGNVRTLMWSYPQVMAKQNEPIPGSNVMYNYYRTTSDAVMKEIGGQCYGDWRNTLLHEFGGHAFARFTDEFWSGISYAYNPIASHTWAVPYALNVASDYNAVQWQEPLLDRKDALVSQDAHYERIGIFQGGDRYMFNRWRSEMVSSMVDYRAYFSAWQRILIVRRIMDKVGGTFSLDDFFAADKTNDPMRDETSGGSPGIDMSKVLVIDLEQEDYPSPVFGAAEEKK